MASDVQAQSDRGHLKCVASLRPVRELLRLCEQGHLDEAVTALFCMDRLGITPPVTLYSSVLRACARRKALIQSRAVHASLATHGLETTRFLGEFMVSTLVKCGGFEDALQLFHRLPYRTVFSWTAVISGYSAIGQGREALRVYYCMQTEGLDPDKFTFRSLLKACTSMRDLEEGRRIHSDASKYRCASDVFVGSCLIDMYAECGCLEEALSAFDGLSQPSVISWNAMLVAYVRHGQVEKALQLYGKMEEQGVSPNEQTFITLLQACGIRGGQNDRYPLTREECLNQGKKVHSHLQAKGYDSKVLVANTLISMYGKCGSIVDAERVFTTLMHRDTVSWNAMISAYTKNGHPLCSLQLYERMWEEGIRIDDRSLVSGILACTSLAEREELSVNHERFKVNPLEKGKILHLDAQNLGYDSDVFVGNSLISLYGACGSVLEAWSVFNGLHHKDLVSWNAMVGAFAQLGEPEKALQLYIEMQEKGISPDARTFVSIIQACALIKEDKKHGIVDGRSVKVKSLEWGKRIHEEARKKDFDLHVFVGNALITMYGKCGTIMESEDVFCKLANRDVVSWNGMLAAYVEQGYPEAAFDLYQKMQLQGMTPDVWSSVAVLQASALLADKEVGVHDDGLLPKMESLQRGKVLHAHIWKTNLQSTCGSVENTLISMYGKCRSVLDAQAVYNKLVPRNLVSFNAMLAAYCKHGDAEKAWELYEQILREGVSPNESTFVSIIQACGILGGKETGGNRQFMNKMSLQKAKAVHADASRRGYVSDVFVGSSLIFMYGKCGSVVDAHYVFENVSHQSVAAWTAMMSAFVDHHQANKALNLYEQMQWEGISPDACACIGALQACGKIAEAGMQFERVDCLERVRAIHGYAQGRGYDSDNFLAAALVTALSKCGALVEAQNLFDGFCKQDIVMWNAILAGLVQHGQQDKALQIYRRMVKECVHPNDVTAILILQACSITGSLDTCRQVHHNVKAIMNCSSPLLATTLIHAYGRCGSMADAQSVFNALTQTDVVSWNSLIAGYARQGNYVASFVCFESMGQAGIEPDLVTFVLLLSACSHAGLVGKGVDYFAAMSKEYGINPEIQHYVSMVDLLGRAGHFSNIERMLSTMPIPADLALYLCLLGACKKHGNISLAQRAFHCAVSLHPEHTAAYRLMSNIYDASGDWVSANKVEEVRLQRGAWKEPGQSWIEHEKHVHRFMVGTR